jgi:hypothetical protein
MGAFNPHPTTMREREERIVEVKLGLGSIPRWGH